MADEPARRARWTLTGDAFRLLLASLDADTERAGEKYERLRSRLIAVFGWERCGHPEECADEALNRLAKAIEGGTEVQSTAAFLNGVVRMILKEQFREETRRSAALRQYQLQSGETAPSEEMLRLEKCLHELPEESRRLIERYYEGERMGRIRNRQNQAAELGIPMNALRNRELRIRARLESCLGEFLERRDGTEETDTEG